MKEPKVRFLTGGEIKFQGRTDPITGASSAALFVLLVLNRQEALSREYLASVIWPDRDAATARQRLRMALMKLRHQLEPGLAENLKATRDSIRLQLETEDCDFSLFEKMASSDSQERRLQAIELYAGDLLSRFTEVSEIFDTVIRSQRADLRARFFALCHSCLEKAGKAGNDELFERVLQAALRIDPTSAEFVITALRHYGHTRQLQLIDETFDIYETALANELDEAPDQSIIALREEMLKSAKQSKGPTLFSNETTAQTRAPLTGMEPSDPENPVGRRKINQRRVLIIGVFCILAAIGVALGIFRKKPAPVFIFEQPDVADSDCSVSSGARYFESAVQKAFLTVEDAVVLLSGADQFDFEEPKKAYLVEIRATCEGTKVRGSLTISRKSNGEVLLVGRYDLSDVSESEYTSMVISDLESVTFR